MLENALTVATQVFILFILIGVGLYAAKARMINETGIKQLTNLLLVIIMPAVIIRSFQTPYNPELLRGLLIALVSSLAAHVAGALLARLVFRNQEAMRNKVLRFSVVFSNCGFMCIPLLDIILGDRGVLYGSVYIAVFNVAQWTYGVRLMTGKRQEINFMRALVNPGTVAIAVALPLYLLGVTLPEIPLTVISYLAAINSPLAMIIIGVQLAGISFASLFADWQVSLASLLRLIIVPVLILFVLHLVPLPLDRTLILACLIPAAAPTAAGASLFATRHDQDTLLAGRTIALSTLLSIVTIPALILLSDYLTIWLG